MAVEYPLRTTDEAHIAFLTGKANEAPASFLSDQLIHHDGE